MEIIEENKLEELLRLAADEPAHRPQFYDVLLNSQVFVLGETEESEIGGEKVLVAGSKIQIRHWERADGAPAIPFFSSLDVLQNSIDSEESYLALPVRSLFEMTLGATLFLNPKSDYGKELSPEEVSHLLSNGIGREVSQRVVEKETKVLLGQPSIYPTKMIESLIQLLAKHSNVEKAYLALMHDTSVDEKPHLIIGIKADGDFEKVMREVGSVAADSAPEEGPIDLYRVENDETGVSGYFINQTEPFYERKRGSKLRSWLGLGKA